MKDKKYCNVRDYCHYTGEYRGTAHSLKEITIVDKNGEEVTKNISYILQFIDSARFIASFLSNLVNNPSEGIHKIKCKHGHSVKKCEICRIKYKYCDCFLEYKNFKDDSIEKKCLCCKKSYR